MPTMETAVPGGRLFRHILSLLLFATAAPLALNGQALEARATVSPSTVGLNQQFVLNVELGGAGRMDGEPSLPDVGNFARYLGRSSSTNMQIINGVTTASVTIQYRFQAISEGTFEIGAVEVEAQGRVLRTSPVTLTVAATANPGGRPGADAQSGVGPDDLFMVAEVSQTSVYQNQPIEVSYRLFTRVNVNAFNVVDVGENEGFWVEDVPSPPNPQVEQRVLNGQQYTTAVVRRVVLFPVSPGTKTVEPLSVEASVRVQRRRRSIFDDVFGSQEPVVIASEPVEVEVLPLPAAGRPQSFTGLVGRLDVSASLDRSSVETNDAVTLEVTVEGEGNMQGLAAPVMDLGRDFEVFPPEVTQSIDRSGARIRGVKTYQYVLIPRSPGVRTIPPIEMSYFIPDGALYASSASQPLRLEVTGDAVVVAPAGRIGVETLREDIRFIRIGSPSLGVIGGSLVESSGFWVVVVLPLVAMLGSLALRQHWDRLEGDLGYARGRRAGRVAKKRLARANALLPGSDARSFYAEVERALRGFLADKLNVAEAGFMADAAEGELKRRGVSEEVVSEYLACLSVCDRARFAPPGSSAAEKSGFFGRVTEAMTTVQEQLS